MAEAVAVAKASEIPEGQCKQVVVGQTPLLICHAQGRFYAIDDTCTHDDGPLADGSLDGYEIECPRHGARFDIRTGKVLCLPAAVAIRTYPVRVNGQDIMVEVR